VDGEPLGTVPPPRHLLGFIRVHCVGTFPSMLYAYSVLLTLKVAGACEQQQMQMTS
jgi:hypothetical protein